MADTLSAPPVQPLAPGIAETLWALHDVKFWRIDGSLLSVENSSEARVFGGGRTSVNATYEEPIYSASIDTEITRYTTFWVQEEGGRECSFRIVNWDVPLRAGQTVSVLCAARGDHRSCIAGIVNHTSKMSFINEQAMNVLFPRQGALSSPGFYNGAHWVISYFWAIAILGIQSMSWKLVALLLLVIWFVAGRSVFRRRARRRNAIASRIHLLTDMAASK